MLRLENVSKFYSANGLITTGFSKVSLDFEMGEFVAITGESGSGKSTLLNVICGLDSYEEGEMFILDKPTSGFSREDLEEYRKKYIGTIFQTFNLINSYTVYQNVELILLMSGYKREESSLKVNEILEKVGLSEYAKTKASKLSGGQKQRVAIARALAKETPIIVADEPTGNLDSQSANEIIKLLHEISKEKLIIIVTHNFDQVEEYVTRKISMHDGRIAEDKRFDEEESNEIEAVPGVAGKLSFGNMARLSVRNTFNIPAKFLLLLIVFLFLCAGTIAQYSSFLNAKEETSDLGGFSQYFRNTGKERILLTKPDKGEFNDKDYEKLSSIDNIKTVVKNDLILDISGSIATDGEEPVYISTAISNASDYESQLVEGRMPEKENEVVLIFDRGDTYVGESISSIYEKKLTLYNDNTGDNLLKSKVKIVGYGYTTTEQTEKLQSGSMYLEGVLCFTEKGLDNIRASGLENYCSQEIRLGDSIMEGNSGQGLFTLQASKHVPKGELYIPEDIGNVVEYPVGREISITNKSIYFSDRFKFTVGAVYTEYNMEYYLNRKDFEDMSGSIFINPQDYKKMFEKGNYQSSVMVSDTKKIEETQKAIEDAGFKTFRVNKGLVNEAEGINMVMNVLRTVLLVIVLVVLFFITYFITKLILRSRNTYYAIIRMIGGTKDNCRNMLRTELFVVFNIVYFVCIAVIVMLNKGLIASAYMLRLISFLEIKDYIILYVLLCAMSLLLANRYARQLFKKTAMRTHAEEV